MGMLKQYQKGLTGNILTLKIQTYLEPTHYSSDSEDSDDEIPLAQQKHELFKKLRVKVKVKVTDHTVKYVFDLWQSIANQFVLPKCTLILNDIAEGCICITWLTPTNLVKYITRMAQEMVNMFAENHFMRVMLEEQCIYSIETEPPSPPVIDPLHWRPETEPLPPPETKLPPPETELPPPETEPLPPPDTEQCCFSLMFRRVV